MSDAHPIILTAKLLQTRDEIKRIIPDFQRVIEDWRPFFVEKMANGKGPISAALEICKENDLKDMVAGMVLAIAVEIGEGK